MLMVSIESSFHRWLTQRWSRICRNNQTKQFIRSNSHYNDVDWLSNLNYALRIDILWGDDMLNCIRCKSKFGKNLVYIWETFDRMIWFSNDFEIPATFLCSRQNKTNRNSLIFLCLCLVPCLGFDSEFCSECFLSLLRLPDPITMDRFYHLS